MKERSLILTGESVNAILAGQKTMTRRVVNPQFGQRWGAGCPNKKGFSIMQPAQTKNWRDAFAVHTDRKDSDGRWLWLFCPYGKVGDRLWVKETLKPSESGITIYKQNGCPAYRDGESVQWMWPKAKSVTQGCPRWASRITLEITDVRVDRLQDISEEDAMAEGIEPTIRWQNDVYGDTYRDAFANLWDKINGKKYPWQSNPWVWVISFKVV